MMRTSAHRTLLRSFTQTSLPKTRFVHNAAKINLIPSFKQQNISLVIRQAKTSSITPYRLLSTSLVRRDAGAAPGTFRRPDKEQKFAQKYLEPNPAGVSSTSTTTPLFGPSEESKDEDVDMMAGIRHDISVIKDTFAFTEVPREAYNIGLAGVLPYLATSTATVVCAFELNNTARGGGFGYIMSGTTAENLLHILEPLQVGYGAVILSFLGAIHWGLEWAGYGGHIGYRKYGIGVFSTAIAWPTVLLPVEYALICQFFAFNTLYAIDNSATTRGWTPPWYGTYRFVLTFIVGASIVLSLIGRGQIQDRIGEFPTATKRIQEMQKAGLTKSGEEE